MSWNFQVEVGIQPNECGYQDAVKLIEMEVEKVKKQPVTGFPSLRHVGYVNDQLAAAVATARELFSRTRTEYPAGCNVIISCDGHTGGDGLNFEPHHVCVRIQVHPRPYHR